MEEFETRKQRIVTAIGLLLVIAFATSLHAITTKILDDRLRREFEHKANTAQLAIDARVRDYADILHGVAALFQTSTLITREQFHRYVTALDLASRYPGVRSVNYAETVTHDQKNAFESTVRTDRSMQPAGYPNFAVKPPGVRPAYHVLTYLEPPEQNNASFGMDIAANPQVAQALDRSRDTGLLTSSGALIRVQGDHRHVGIAMRLPLYKHGAPLATIQDRQAAYVGSVGAGFEVEKVMLGVLDAPAFKHLQFKLYDVGRVDEQREEKQLTPERLLFDSLGENYQNTSPSNALYTAKIPMQVGGRAWHSSFSASKDAMIETVDRILPWIVFAGGSIMGLLALKVFQSLSYSRREAIRIARVMTKDLRESEATLADAQRMAHLGNWMLDPATSNMTWSQEIRQLIGAQADNVPANLTTFLERFDADHRTAVNDQLTSAIAKHEEIGSEHRIVRPDGTVLWVYMISRCGVDAQEGMICGTLMDITERKQIERTLFEKNVELEASNLAKDRFLANMSHELRTPLNAILGFTGTLLMKLPGPLSVDQEKQLQTIRSSGRHLLSLINDMLDLAKIESGKFELNCERTSCREVIDGVSRTLQSLAEQKRLALHVAMPDEDIVILTDQRALTQILLNLVNNAIKFTESGRIDIRLSHRPVAQGEEVSISVTDTGIGIREEDQAKLFQTFTQVDASLTRPFEGTGLGLYLSQKLAQLMGGIISCRSEYGNGSCFTLVLFVQSVESSETT